MSAYDDMSDEQLLVAWKGGDQRAGATLFDRHHKPVARFFVRRFGPDTDDLVQNTFLGLLTGLDRFREDASFRTYLFAIARNQLLRTIRDRMRDRERFDPGETSIAAVDPSPSALMAANDQQKLLLAALRRLPVDVQIMLELHYWEKLKIKDIALVLDMSESNVKVRMMRGRRKLDELMVELAESKEQLQTTLNGLSKWVAQLREEVGGGGGDDDGDPN